MKFKFLLLLIIVSQKISGQDIMFSVTSGFFDTHVELVLTTPLSGEIRYTLDGSEPTAQSEVFSDLIVVKDRNHQDNTISTIPTNPATTPEQYVWRKPAVTIPKSSPVNAAVFNNTTKVSQTFCEEYFIGASLHEIQMPIFSIHIDNSDLFDYDTGIYVPGRDYDANPNIWQPGNYYERGDDWERVMSLSYYKNQHLAFKQDTELQIHGGGSRIMPCKSLRLSAKKSLGNNFMEYPFFPNRPWSAYKRILLRNAGQDWNHALFADVLMQSLIGKLDIEHQASRQVVLFINGSYWGIHNLREKYDKYYFSNYHDNDIEAIDYIEIADEFIAKEGNALAYEQMNESLLFLDLSKQANYESVAQQIDIPNYIDHHISKVYGGGTDWSGNNERLWRTQDGKTKWRWVANDYDDAFKNVAYDAYRHATRTDWVGWPNPEWSTRLFRSLMTNEKFSSQYKSRLRYHLENTYASEVVVAMIDSVASIYRPEIARQIERWNYPSSVDAWEQTITAYKSFAAQRPNFLWDNFLQYFPDLDSPSEQIVLRPNPSKDYFYLDLPKSFDENSTLRIFSAQGKSVFQTTLPPYRRVKIELPKLNSGIYIVKVFHQDQEYIEKLILQ